MKETHPAYTHGDEEKDEDTLFTNNTSHSSRSTVSWAVKVIGGALEGEAVDDSSMIRSSHHSRRFAWDDIKGFVASTFGEQDNVAHSDEPAIYGKSPESKTETTTSEKSSWGTQVMGIMDISSLGLEEETAHVNKTEPTRSNSLDLLSAEAISDTMQHLENSIKDLSFEPSTLGCPTRLVHNENKQARANEQDEATEQYNNSIASLQSHPPPTTILDAIKEEPLGSSKDSLLSRPSLDALDLSRPSHKEEPLGSSKDSLLSRPSLDALDLSKQSLGASQTNHDASSGSLQTSERTRKIRRGKKQKAEDMNWKNIQKIIKDKKVSTSAGVKRIVYESLHESLGELDPDKPDMVLMHEALTRFSEQEAGKHHKANRTKKRFWSRWIDMFISNLSEEAVRVEPAS